MTGLEIERVFEPSRIRRGRMATSPVFIVRMPDGSRWRFMRRKDAQAFVARGGCSDHSGILCRNCNGMHEGWIRPASPLPSDGGTNGT